MRAVRCARQVVILVRKALLQLISRFTTTRPYLQVLRCH
jgi:hypothetical protein